MAQVALMGSKLGLRFLVSEGVKGLKRFGEVGVSR